MLASRLLTLCAALLLIGCSGSDIVKPPPAPLVEFKPTATLKLSWRVGIGSAQQFVFTPAVVNDVVYAAAADGSLARIEDGREVWRINAGHRLSGGVGADRALVAVGTVGGRVLTFDARSGQPRWQAQTYADVLAAPVIGAGLVFVRSGDARIYAFDAETGARKWIYQITAPALTLRSNAGLLLVDRVLFAGFAGGKLAVINTSNGAALWEGQVAMPKGTTEIERIADIASAPVVAGRQGCAAAFQGRLACFDFSASTSPIWSKDVSSRTGLDLNERGELFVSDDKGALLAYNVANGASLWRQDQLANRELTRPLVLGNYVIVGDGLGVVHVLRQSDGAFAARYDTNSAANRGDLPLLGALPENTAESDSIVAAPQRLSAYEFVIQTQDGDILAFALH